MRKSLKIFGALMVAILIGLCAFAGWSLYPHTNLLALPGSLVSLESAEGADRLGVTPYNADYQPLSDWYQAQSLVSYCGVASSVTVLGALGMQVSQSEFFTDRASQIRPRLKVVFGGMSLPDLAGLLRSYDVQVSVQHADGFDIAQFRDALERNLAHSDDYLIINYQREVLGQGTVGHMSPVAAYDRASDSVLIMDTAAHKYPPTWAPLELVYAAMKTRDAASGMMRGYIEVSQ